MAAAFVLSSCSYLGAAERIDFSRDVRPILSDRCYFCHGPDAERREADLRLDDRESSYESAIVPGKPEESELIARIFSHDASMIMPPPESKLSLTDSERSTLKQWIAQGAPYGEHWAFLPIRKPPLPEVPAEAQSSHPIDRFVRAKLTALGLHAGPPADRETLIRRLSFDLTGLPPSQSDVDAFLANEDEGAYEQLVDQLLSSKQYGERMAVDWLDLARYADTYGYQNDRYRPMWPWRDWVVKAYNDNLPFDDFIRQQLAGDLLPNATDEQILATAFNRNHRQTNEGGSVEEEYRAEYVADRVNTFGAAFLGLTLECCRCHDHKFDPITQREYYQLSAFFNSIDESGLYSHFTEATPTPTLLLSEPEQATKLATLLQEIQTKQLSLDELQIDEPGYLQWRRSLGDVRPASVQDAPDAKSEISLTTLIQQGLAESLIGDFPLESIEGNQLENLKNPDQKGKVSEDPEIGPARVGNGLHLSGENNATFKTAGEFSRNQPFTLSLWIKAPRRFERAVVLHRSKAWTDSGSRGYELLIENGRLSAALIHFWPGNAIRVIANQELSVNRWTHVSMVYDGSSRAQGLQLFVDGDRADTSIVRDHLTKHIQGSDGFSGGDANELTLGQRFRDIGFKDGQVDQLKVFDRNLSPLELKILYQSEAFPDNRSEVVYNAPESLLREYFRAMQPDHRERAGELKNLRDAYSRLADPVPEIMVMREQETPRPTHVLNRGAYDAPGELVTRGTLSKILPRKYAEQPDRRDLAEWLVDPDHPLTARVAVNRYWQMIFGRGLVESSEDFGLQGSPPSHPEMLDWLSYDFIHTGWNVKGLIKQMVMSDTYRQTSNPNRQLLEMDPENRMLTRGPALRLPAEMIRDAVLSASGLLVETLGGPPVKPFQPEGLWEEKSGLAYNRDAGEGSHRRSLYTYWKRTSPPPSMMTFDASNREVCVVKRQVTMTPLQMLVLLNDPQYVEAAKALAARALKACESQDQQLEFVFRSLVTRKPTKAELNILHQLFQEQRNEFLKDATQAEELLSVGDTQVDPELDAINLAAMTVVAEGLMSYDETVMKR